MGRHECPFEKIRFATCLSEITGALFDIEVIVCKGSDRAIGSQITGGFIQVVTG